MAGGVAAACSQLHSRGVVHGDIYGHNILWRASDGECLLGDFGAATSTGGLDAADKAAMEKLEVSGMRANLFESVSVSLCVCMCMRVGGV